MRNIKLHEYQAGRLLNKYRVPTVPGSVAFNAKEAYIVAKNLGKSANILDFVVKAQILGGGRGMGHFKETGF